MPRLGAHQAALYDAQWAGGPGREFKDIREVRSYVDNLVESNEFQALWPEVFVVNVERRNSNARWSMAIPAWNTICLADLSHLTILHEVAHLCSPAPGHGPEFARAFLTLVRREMGFHAYGAIQTALRGSEAFRGCDLETCAPRHQGVA